MKRPPNDLTADEWNAMRKAADKIDALLGDLMNGKRKIDANFFVECLGATETIQSTINLVIGAGGED